MTLCECRKDCSLLLCEVFHLHRYWKRSFCVENVIEGNIEQYLDDIPYIIGIHCLKGFNEFGELLPQLMTWKVITKRSSCKSHKTSIDPGQLNVHVEVRC